MNNNFPLYPDDRSNEFGSANNLETNGGVFDSVPNNAGNKPVNSVNNVNNVNNDILPQSAEMQSFVQSEPVPAPAPESVPSSDDKRANKGSGAKRMLICALAVAAAAAAFAFVWFSSHAILGDLFGRHAVYSTGTKEINLSGSDYKDYSPLSKVKSLEVIDLTNSSFVSLSDLYDCKNLKKVILADRELSAGECMDFYSRLPEARLVCKIRLNGQVYASDVTELTVENADAASQKLYAALKDLQSLDMTACDVSDDTYRSLTQALPDCAVIIRTTVGGTEYTTDAASLTVSGELTAEDVERIGYFKNLTSIDLRKCSNPDILDTFLSANPDVRLNKPIQLLGRDLGTEDEFVDLRGSKYTLEQVKAALDEALPKMKSLKKIDMCGCGLSNRQMEQLCNDYPNIKFVWMVRFVNWTVRTDAVMFSTLNSEGKSKYTQVDYAPLFKYCTDLVALDLGHSRITDISAIASLKKLRAVILMDNKITDISAFAELKDLEFIEMNATNRVKSVEPLKDLKNLKYINLWGSMGISDLSPLYNHENLKIVIFERTVPKEEQENFIKSNPNCDTYFDMESVRYSTNTAWRENPYRKKIKSLFGRTDANNVLIREWKYVVGFDEKTGDYILDYNTDQYSIM